ncbi:glycoside hydrolase family 76 protein [Olivibacter sitiensis]|uniref:glycoside hydrolase family 76 protein n=1 Tax=Olivibacter sitiensis TaxID=376470 RepID=UPI0009FCD002|nr:glycoside hydrolase family 76 protein [Olivibacter sitiensis]
MRCTRSKMWKWTAAMLLGLSCGACSDEAVPLYPDRETEQVNYTWHATADSLQATTYEVFLSANGRYFKENNTSSNNFHYWWNAHMLDVLVDGYERTEDAAYVPKMKNLLLGIRETNNGHYPNEFYDDMEWLALSALRAYDLTQDADYLDAVEILWADIQTGINDHQGGGVAWRKGQLDYKNTPANAPAIILACRLYERFGSEEDIEQAVSLYEWLKNTLIDPSTGIAWDGINRNGDGEIDKSWLFTYNQGVVIGAGLELYRNTQNTTYLQDAVRTAKAALNSMSIAPGGILNNENQGDGGLFKGIMVRYLTLLAMEEGISSVDREDFLRFLLFNGQTVFSKSIARPSMMVGPDWNNLPGESTDLSTQLSGVMMMEAISKLQDGGLIE